MWLWAHWFFSHSFLHEILPFSHSIHCFRCWGLFFGSRSLLLCFNFLLRLNFNSRSNLWVCLWFLVMSSLIFGFSCHYILLGIVISVIGVSLTTSPFLTFIFLVLRTISTCGWLKTQLPASSLVLYFVVSATGGLLFLLGSHSPILCPLFTSIALLLLLGFFPFQFWAIRILPHLSITYLIAFLGPIKIGLLWLVVSLPFFPGSLVLINALLGCFLIWSTVSLSLMLFGSGVCQLIILVYFGAPILFFYLAIYFLCLFPLSSKSWKWLRPLMAILCLGGLPPFGIFWAKIIAFSCLSFLHSTSVFLLTMLTFWPYVRFGLTCSSDYPSSLSVCILMIVSPALLYSF